MSHLATTTDRQLGRHGRSRQVRPRLRNRSIALAALLFALAGIAFTFATSGGGHARHSGAAPVVRRPATAIAAPRQRRPTLNQQLQDLQVGVKVAAGR